MKEKMERFARGEFDEYLPKVELPKEISGIAKCMNPKCVTNHQPITTRFTVNVKGNETSLLCHYCEKISDTKKVF